MVRFKPTWSGMVVAALLASLAVVIGSVVVTEKPASRMLPRVFRVVSAQEDIFENQSTADRVLPLPLVEAENLSPPPAELLGVDLTNQSVKQAALKSHGCITCHVGVGDMHRSPNVVLGCTDCHRTNAQ